MKNMQRTVSAAVVCLGLALAAGCVVDQTGHVVVYPNAPVLVHPVPAGNYQIQNLRQRAEQGDAIAQFTLGSCYANGRGIVRNYAEAARCYRLSAEQGYAAAQNRLGVCYSRGLGVAQNYAEAVAWYRKAAEQGNAFAEDNLGACYSSGHGVARDLTEAVKWYRLSAGQGNAVAQNHLGNCYYNVIYGVATTVN
jgi:TPR repeat protein